MSWFSSGYDKLTLFYAHLSRKLCYPKAFPPIHVFYSPTYRCNLDCGMCIALDRDADSATLKAKELSLEEIAMLFEQIPRYSLLTLTGGEPTLRRDFLDILKLATEKHLVSVITNGTLLKPEQIQSMLKLTARSIFSTGLLEISLSLLGPPAIHEQITKCSGSYEKLLETAHYMQKFKSASSTQPKKGKKPLLSFRTVILEENLKDLNHIIDKGVELGVDHCIFMIQDTVTKYNPIPLLSEAEFPQQKEAYYPQSKSYPLKFNIPSLEVKSTLEQVLSEAKRKGIKVRITPVGFSPAKVAEYYAGKLNLNNFECLMPYSNLVISAYGDIQGCFAYSAGNIRKENLKKVWNGSDMIALRKKLNTEGLFSACSGCCALRKHP